MPSERLTSSLVAVKDLSEHDRDQMFSLMVTYYVNVDRHVFEADLRDKQWVILLIEGARNEIRGFSTQVLLDGESGNERVLFSGDTIVDRNYWAKNELARAWGRFALSLIDSHPTCDLYWFLIAKGYKTYRFLPLFFHEFYPCVDIMKSARLKQLATQVALNRFPTRFSEQSGIIVADHHACCLRSGVADISPQRLRDPHVRFFVEQNPGHAHGDELCCLAPLTRENFTSAARRVIGEASLALMLQ
jgi:hypothetical protein